MAQGLVEAAETVEVADHQIVIARIDQQPTRGDQEARTVMQARQGVGVSVLDRQSGFGTALLQAEVVTEVGHQAQHGRPARPAPLEIDKAMVLQAQQAVHMAVIGGGMDVERGQGRFEPVDFAGLEQRHQLVDEHPPPQGRQVERSQIALELEPLA